MKNCFIAITVIGIFFSFSCSKGTGNESGQEEQENVVPVLLSLPDVYFTEPAKVAAGQSSYTITDKLIQLVKATPAKDSIHLCIYLMDYPALEDELVKAHQRGVVVKIILDKSREESIQMNSMLVPRLSSRLSAPSEVVATVSDAGSTAINHNKFLLISSAVTTNGKRNNIVFQTSHNWNISETKKMQDALVLSNEGVYHAFRNYWNQLKQRAGDGMNQFYYDEFHEPGIGLTAFFLPKRRNGTAYGDDTIIEILNKITTPATATIRIGMSDWVKSRINVAEKLLDLRKKGAKVELVVKSSIDMEVQQVLKELMNAGGTVKMYNMTQPGQKVNIHAKFMLIEGSWSGGNAKVLVTGSHNFTTNALRNNNEILLQWVNAPLYDNYVQYFNELKTIPGINF
ncbi:MAG: phospholipase D-like domain-containing protein [Chitinophagaceae bacterium]